MSDPQPSPDQPRDLNELFPVVYGELRALAAAYMKSERANHTLQPTALANEVFLKISKSDRRIFDEKSQFMAAAAQAIRRILTDHARGKRASKRGGGATEECDVVRLGTSDPGFDVVDFDDALSELSRLKPRLAQVVELRVFGGLTLEQVAQNLSVATSTVSEDWATAKAWLKSRLD